MPFQWGLLHVQALRHSLLRQNLVSFLGRVESLPFLRDVGPEVGPCTCMFCSLLKAFLHGKIFVVLFPLNWISFFLMSFLPLLSGSPLPCIYEASWDAANCISPGWSKNAEWNTGCVVRVQNKWSLAEPAKTCKHRQSAKKEKLGLYLRCSAFFQREKWTWGLESLRRDAGALCLFDYICEPWWSLHFFVNTASVSGRRCFIS